MTTSNDYPLSAVPESNRKGFWSMTAVLTGFTFFTATMWAGGTLGSAFSFGELMLIIVLGNLLLGAYAAALGYIASKTGLNSVLLGRYCFGEQGSKLADIILGFTQIGWYAWGTATIAIVLVKLLGLPEGLTTPLMVLFGFGFCATAFIGYRGLELLSKVSVPLMLIFIAISIGTGTGDAGGLQALLQTNGDNSLAFSAAITMVFGTFASGGTQATNWSRFAGSGKIAVFSTLLAFFVGNGLMVFTGAFGALIYQQADIVDVLVSQGLMLLAVLMLFTNLWTTQDNTIYNFAAAGCNLLRTEKRRAVTIAGAAVGTVMAIFGMYNLLIPFLILLGTFIPPIGALIMTDFWVRYRGKLPSLEQAQLPAFNQAGLAAYVVGSAAAYFSPWVAPVVGIIVSSACYSILLYLSTAQPRLSEEM